MGVIDCSKRLGGLYLRYELCLVLHEARGRSLTVAEIIERVEADGFTLGPLPHKVVADALRWEVRRGRARRVRRGVFATGHLARSSESKMRLNLRKLRAELAARHHPDDGDFEEADANADDRGATAVERADDAVERADSLKCGTE
ncbi:MAG: hypothetical protein QOJ00_598 [Actinomycetota bacterium]